MTIRRRLALALRAVNVLGAGLAAGGQLTVLAAIVPVARTWPPERSIDLHRETLTYRPDRLLRPASIASVVSGALTPFVEERRSPTSIAWLITGVAAMIGVAAISERHEFPTNRMLLALPSPADVPDDYEQIRKDWDRHHAARGACGATSAVCFVFSALTREH